MVFLYLISRILNCWVLITTFTLDLWLSEYFHGFWQLWPCSLLLQFSTYWLLVVHLFWSLYMLIFASHSWFWNACLSPTTEHLSGVHCCGFSQHNMPTSGLICGKSDLEVQTMSPGFTVESQFGKQIGLLEKSTPFVTGLPELLWSLSLPKVDWLPTTPLPS